MEWVEGPHINGGGVSSARQWKDNWGFDDLRIVCGRCVLQHEFRQDFEEEIGESYEAASSASIRGWAVMRMAPYIRYLVVRLSSEESCNRFCWQAMGAGWEYLNIHVGQITARTWGSRDEAVAFDPGSKPADTVAKAEPSRKGSGV